MHKVKTQLNTGFCSVTSAIRRQTIVVFSLHITGIPRRIIMLYSRTAAGMEW